MCVSRLSVLIVRKLCIFTFFALCFSVFGYIFIVMSCLLPFFVCTSCTILILLIIGCW